MDTSAINTKLPKAVYDAECSEVTSHGRHPVALSPDAFARGRLFTCITIFYLNSKTFFNLTTLNVYTLYLLRNGNNEDESDDESADTEDENQGGDYKGAHNPESRQSAANPEPYG